MPPPRGSPEHRGESGAILNPNPAERRARQALIAGLFLVLVWGANFSVQKFIFAEIGPGAFLFARYLIMPLCAVALMLYWHGLAWPRLVRSDAWLLVRLGVAGHFLHVGMVSYGIHLSTAFSSSVILACGPVFTLLILRALRVETLRRLQVIGVVIALGGVLIFLSDKVFGGRWRASGGDLVLLASATFFSYYTVAAKPLMERLGSVTVMAYATCIGAVPIVLVTLPVGLTLDWAALSTQVWAALLWAVIVSAFFGWLFWGWVNAVRGVARTAPLIYLMPPVAGVVSWLVGGELFTGVKLLGAAVTLAGVAVAQFAGPPPPPYPAPAD